MPNGLFGDISAMQAWNQSEFDKTRDNETQQAAQTQAPPTRITELIPDGFTADVERQAGSMTELLPTQIQQSAIPAQKTMTAQEYKTGVTDYLMNTKGYSYDEALRLMAPNISAYEQQEAADNERKAEAIAAQLDLMPIDSPNYRANALKMLKLNPTMAKLYLQDSIGRRDIYNRKNQIADRLVARQQRREDMQFNADLQMDNMIRRQKALDAYKQQQAQEKAQQLISAGWDPKQAIAMALGVGGRNSAGNALGGVSKDDYKWAEDTISGLTEKLENLRLSNPNAQLPAEDIQLFNTASAIRNLANQQRVSRYGIGQQQAQRPKVNVNDYNQLKPMLQALVQKNGGKFDKNIAMLVRKYAGLDPNNANPNEFVNEVFKNDYDFSG